MRRFTISYIRMCVYLFTRARATHEDKMVHVYVYVSVCTWRLFSGASAPFFPWGPRGRGVSSAGIEKSFSLSFQIPIQIARI